MFEALRLPLREVFTIRHDGRSKGQKADGTSEKRPEYPIWRKSRKAAGRFSRRQEERRSPSPRPSVALYRETGRSGTPTDSNTGNPDATPMTPGFQDKIFRNKIYEAYGKGISNDFTTHCASLSRMNQYSE